MSSLRLVTPVPKEEREFIKSAEAADWLEFTGPRAIKEFFKWADRYNVPRLHRGRTVLWERRVLRDFLERKPWTLKRTG